MATDNTAVPGAAGPSAPPGAPVAPIIAPQAPDAYGPGNWPNVTTLTN